MAYSEKLSDIKASGKCEVYYTKKYIYLNAKVSQPFNICIFFSIVHVRILI